MDVASIHPDGWPHSSAALTLLGCENCSAPRPSATVSRRGDGSALLNRLQEIAGIDPASVARRVAANTSLGSRVAANYLGNLRKADFDRLVMAPEMQKAMRSIQESIAATLHNALSPQVTALQPTIQSLHANLVKSLGIEALATRISEQFTRSETMEQLSQAWGKSLSDSMALTPEPLTDLREVQRVFAED